MQNESRCNQEGLHGLAGVGRNRRGLGQSAEMFAPGIRSFPLKLGPE
jgi:hypothetical protein